MKKCRTRLLCLLLAVILLSGCKGDTASQSAVNADAVENSLGTVTVYSENRYKTSLQQLFSHINLTEKRFQIQWTGEKVEADILITDQMDPADYDDYSVIDLASLEAQPIRQMILQDDRGVIGIPVFLRMDGFWYDGLLYDNAGMVMPQSLDSWTECLLNREYPAVCSENDVSALFWGVVAPLYLKFGGEDTSLSNGNFQRESLLKALERLESLRQSGMLRLTSDARQLFTSTQAMFWIAGVERVAESYHYMSTLSSWGVTLGLPFHATEQPVTVLRSDLLMVRKGTDPQLTTLFLQTFFRQQTLAELSEDANIPMACQIEYSPRVVPALSSAAYGALSSPAIELVYTTCSWNGGQQQRTYAAILSLMKGELSAAEAADAILK